jgi:DNA (cytosine-5)-methyltransferase 1
MIKHGQHWTCANCLSSAGEVPAKHQVKVLNLYCGIGGNRAKWPANISITAIEKDVKVAAAYQELYPGDTVIVADAHQYLLKNYFKFDIIWSSPPCQSHTRMNFWFENKRRKYADMSLYQQVIMLKHFFKGKWIVENVTPYYDPLIKPNYKVGRHSFWCNFEISDFEIENIGEFIFLESKEDKQRIMDWLGIQYKKNLYLSGKNYIQVFRNAVHPSIGLSIFNDCIRSIQVPPENSGALPGSAE